jgi:phage shock protein A
LLSSRGTKCQELDAEMLVEEAQIARVLGDIPSRPGGGKDERLSTQKAHGLVGAAEAASRWLSLEEALRREKSGMRSMEHEVEDLEYQIQTLKKRFGEGERDAKKEIDRLRTEIEKLYAEKTETLRRLSHKSTLFGGRVTIEPP